MAVEQVAGQRVPDERVIAGHVAGCVNRHNRDGGRLHGRFEVLARQDHGALTIELDDADGLTVAVYAGVLYRVGPR